MALVGPEVRARDALAAMKECLFDDDDHGELRHAAIVVDHGAPDLLIANDQGPAGDTKRFAAAGDKEDQADAGVLQHIVERVDAAVAATIRNRERRVIKSFHKTHAISLWGEIDHAKRIRRADHDER